MTLGSEHDHDSGDPLQWLRDSIPGEPGVDYPITSTVQVKSYFFQNSLHLTPIYVFSCHSLLIIAKL